MVKTNVTRKPIHDRIHFEITGRMAKTGAKEVGKDLKITREFAEENLGIVGIALSSNEVI